MSTLAAPDAQGIAKRAVQRNDSLTDVCEAEQRYSKAVERMRARARKAVRS
jgi:hypothetical protein